MNKINIFLSSAMGGELNDERKSIIQLFSEDVVIRNFYELYAIEERASSKEIEEAFLSEVSKADIIICLLKMELRQPVKKEYERARQENKKVFIYLYEDQSIRSSELNAFIKDEIYKYDPGKFNSTYRLLQNIKQDIHEDIISTYRSTIRRTEYDVLRKDSATSFSYFRFFDPITIENNKENFVNLSDDQFILLVEEVKDKQGNYKTALLISEIGLDFFPSEWKLYNNRGIILEEMGLKEHAFLSYQKALEIKGDDETILYNIGNYYYEKRKYSTAIEYFLKSIEINAKKDNALNKLSLSYRSLKNQSLFLKYAKEAFEIKNSEMYAINYAIALSENEMIPDAYKVLEENLDIKSQRYTNTKAYVLWKEQNTSEIIKLLGFGELVDNREVALILFESYLIEQKVNEAKFCLSTIEKNITYTDFDYNNVGYLFGKYNFHKDAIRYLKMSIELNPLFVEPVISLIANLAESKQYNEALKECEKALLQFPFEPKLIRNKYLIYLHQGKMKEGIKFLFNKTFTVTGLEDKIPEGIINKMFDSI